MNYGMNWSDPQFTSAPCWVVGMLILDHSQKMDIDMQICIQISWTQIVWSTHPTPLPQQGLVASVREVSNPLSL